jgi:hypothetical protein
MTCIQQRPMAGTQVQFSPDRSGNAIQHHAPGPNQTILAQRLGQKARSQTANLASDMFEMLTIMFLRQPALEVAGYRQPLAMHG